MLNIYVYHFQFVVPINQEKNGLLHIKSPKLTTIFIGNHILQNYTSQRVVPVLLLKLSKRCFPSGRTDMPANPGTERRPLLADYLSFSGTSGSLVIIRS